MIGQTISHYKILEKLGEGGMGVVYKAQDVALDRPVALKFLPPNLTTSEQDKARFIQEAKAAGILSHPNICPIHAIEDHQGQLFIVMDFVDGHTLRAKRREFSIKEAVDIGVQIADGLGAAHDKGIVHRDIKPENIMIRKGGIVQIMDFGLAKMRGASKLTKAGTMVGTPGYMSPEQVQGGDLDHRSDIFSLGVLMYELMTGQLPFKGAHEAAILYEIVSVEAAPMSSIKPEIDPELDRIVSECLQKDPDERYQAAKDISRDLKRFKRESGRIVATRVKSHLPHGIEPSSSNVNRHQLAWALVALLSIIGIVILGFYLLRSPERRQVIRTNLSPADSVSLPTGRGADPVVISPDGRKVAYVGLTSQRRRMLYVQSLDETVARQLAGTDGALLPFWSPDNEFVGFFAGTKLRKVSTKGGSPITILDGGAGPRGASWGEDGTILYVPRTLSPLFAVSKGGTAAVLTTMDSSRGENSHRWPYFLPDGKHFLYYSRTADIGGEAEGDAIYIASLDLKVNKRLLNASGNAAYASGYLLFTRQGTLMAQRFDEDKLELQGDPVPIADDVLHDLNYGLASFAVSKTGILVYQTGGEIGGARMLLVDRSGKEIGLLGEVVQHNSLRLSRNGKFVAVSIYDAKSHNQNLWIYDLRSGTKTRFTSGATSDVYPIWSSDDSHMIYTRLGSADYALYEKPISGANNEVLLYPLGGDAQDWSLDAKCVLFNKLSGTPAKWGLWVLQLGGQKKVSRFFQSEFNQQGGRFSPDGKWVAYASDETGSYEAYIRPFPGPGQAVRISPGGTRGGPKWSRNGTELCYLDNEYRMMAVDIKAKGPTVEASQPRTLFNAPASSSGFECSTDANRFVINRLSESPFSNRIVIVQNWDAELKK